MKHNLNFQSGGAFSIETVGQDIQIQIVSKEAASLILPITLADLEELTDLMMDSLYKAQLEQRTSLIGHPTPDI